MENSDEFIAWDDVRSAAEKMFRIWVAGGELEWVEECWGHFQKAGLAGEETILTRTATLLRLVTLARIYEEFSGFAWEENPETPIDYLAQDLKINPVALGILAALAEPEGFRDSYDDDECQLNESALVSATSAQRKEIFDCLCNAYGGDIMLYSRMMKTNPDANEDDCDDWKFKITAGNCQAMQFVRAGF